tara:strand:- start:10636 stop:11103 length:468 start_codon:yes stop_codon:yes gene_type:complete
MAKKNKNNKEKLSSEKFTKKFRKFAQGTIEKLKDLIGKNKSKYDGVIFLMKLGDNGVSFVEGSAATTRILLEETASRDENFANIIHEVSKNLGKDKKESSLTKMLRKQGIQLPDGATAINLGTINPDDMSEDDVEKLIDNIVKDIKKNINGEDKE